jgi:hypothetical protein
LERGEHVEAAAAEAGLALSSLYWRRERDPAFAAAWDQAVEASGAPVLIAPGNGRPLQLQRPRRMKFTTARQETFLARFAASADERAAARAAGVSTDTVKRLRQRDPVFAGAHQAALEAAVAALSAELVRQRIEIQERLRAAVAAGAELGPEEAAEFERSLKLLERFDRRSGRAGPRTVARERLRRWSFGEAIGRLETKLRSMGAAIDEAALPPRPDDGQEAA